jgi:hypothetical protein
LRGKIIGVEVERFVAVMEIKLVPANITAKDNSLDSNRRPLGRLFRGQIPQLIQSNQLFRCQALRESGEKQQHRNKAFPCPVQMGSLTWGLHAEEAITLEKWGQAFVIIFIAKQFTCAKICKNPSEQ